MCADIVLTTDGKVPLTEQELAYLDQFLQAGDRGGFYMAYYNLTGSEAAIVQAKISTFSEVTGGIAFVANFLLQERFRNLPLGSGGYHGIYYLSQQVARSAQETILSSYARGDGGYVTDAAFFRSAASAWEAHNQGNQFPGNFASWYIQATGLTNFTIDGAIQSLGVIVDRLGNNPGQLFEEFNQFLQSDQSLAAAFFGLLGSNVFGKRLSDYLLNDQYRIVDSADGEFTVVLDRANGHTVAVFDDEIIPDDLLNVVETVILPALTPDLAYVGAALVESVPFLSGYFSWLRVQHTESQVPGVYDGDISPNVSNPQFADMTYFLNEQPLVDLFQTGTNNNDTIWGNETLGAAALSGNQIHALGGNDAVFGGIGNDELYGDDGNDILYGQSGDDHLYGGNDNDVLRGGIGSDHLEGGAGDDQLDAADLRPELDITRNTLIGGDGDDNLIGASGSDYLVGDDEDGDSVIATGADIIHGNAGNDVIVGGGGNDSLYGDAGNDTLSGNAGIDLISGGDGDDRLEGGTGDDELIGSNGQDTYVIHDGDGNDRIIDSGQNMLLYIDAAGNNHYITIATDNGQGGYATPDGRYTLVYGTGLTITNTVTGETTTIGDSMVYGAKATSVSV
jgi:RTX calcium-binding nonapeptide repeat (4 copies)